MLYGRTQINLQEGGRNGGPARFLVLSTPLSLSLSLSLFLTPLPHLPATPFLTQRYGREIRRD